MQYPLIRRGMVTAGAAVAAAVVALAVPTGTALAQPRDAARHVLLISVDGLHQSDLSWYAAHHPGSAMASLVHRGTDFTHASTPVPSDSFPGMVAQVTGGNPASAGVYYDSSYDRGLLPPGTTSCAGVAPGANVQYDESIDRNPASLDAGQGLTGLPDSILGLTGQARDLIDPAKLPVDPATCKPLYPHQFVQVNTIFEVAKAHGLRTAWSDKHAAYDILNGPSGSGIDDLFTPEINSNVPGGTGDWTADNAATRRYDGYKATAVINEIDGYDHSRTTKVGVPAIFGMNFQTVSTAEKLPTSDGQAGGYLADGVTPGPLLSGALDSVDKQLGSMLSELRAQRLQNSTTMILSAKHGQSPTDPKLLNRIDDGPIIDGLNAAWTKAHPGAPALVVHSSDDDGMLLWLGNRSAAATAFTQKYLLARSGNGTDITKAPTPYTRSGLARLYVGPGAAAYFHVRPGDARVPDVVGVVVPGVVYTGGTKKIAEHGGAAQADRNVPIVVAGPEQERGRSVGTPVGTTQIAPTILHALGLNPGELRAVRREGTRTLPQP